MSSKHSRREAKLSSQVHAIVQEIIPELREVSQRYPRSNEDQVILYNEIFKRISRHGFDLRWNDVLEINRLLKEELIDEEYFYAFPTEHEEESELARHPELDRWEYSDFPSLVPPPYIFEFLLKLCRHLSPRSVLDVWANQGLLIQAIKERAGAAEVTGWVPSPSDRRNPFNSEDRKPDKAEALDDWVVVEATGANSSFSPGIAAATVPDTEIDLAICLADHRDYTYAVTSVPIGGRTLRSRPREGLLKRVLQNVSAEGAALLAVDSSFFLRGEGWLGIDDLEASGFFLSAAFGVPFGPYSSNGYWNYLSYLKPPQVQVQILLLSRKEHDSVFVAKLEPHVAAGTILRNLSDRRDTGSLAHGIVRSREDFKGFETYALEMALRQAAIEMEAPVCRMGKIAQVRHNKSWFFDDYVDEKKPLNFVWSGAVSGVFHGPVEGCWGGNGVFGVGDSGWLDVLEPSLDDMEYATVDMWEIEFDPSLVLPLYLQRFLRSKHGLALRRYLTAVNFENPFVDKESIQEIVMEHLRFAPFPLPTMTEQERLVRVSGDLEQLQASVSELTEDLWRTLAHTTRIDQEVRALRPSEGPERFATVLPFCLASILHRALASQDWRLKSEAMFNFFLATSLIAVTFLASGYRRSPTLWRTYMEALDRTIDRRSVEGWGYWAMVHSAASRIGLEQLPRFREHFEHAFATDDLALVEAFLSQDLLKCLAEARELRNLQPGHGGATGDRKLRADYERLTSLVTGLRGLLYGPVQDWSMIAPKYLTRSCGVNTHVVRDLTGLPVPFVEREWKSAFSALDSSRLYFLHRNSEEAVELYPLVRFELDRDPTAPICYFYSRSRRDEVRWVSYHSEQLPEDTDGYVEDRETKRLIDELSGRERGSKRFQGQKEGQG